MTGLCYVLHSLKEATLSLGLLSSEEFDQLVRPEREIIDTTCCIVDRDADPVQRVSQSCWDPTRHVGHTLYQLKH